MTRQLKAVYEDGVFRPLDPVRLKEHQEVTLVLEGPEESARRTAEEKPIWEVAADLVHDIPVTHGFSAPEHVPRTPERCCRSSQ